MSTPSRDRRPTALRIGLRAGGAVLVIAAALWGVAWALTPPASTPAWTAEAEVADPDRVRFVAVGDLGEATPAQERVAAGIAAVCAERGCDFGVLLGDNVYPRGLASADDPAGAMLADLPGDDLVWYAVLGNHDYGHSRSWDRGDAQIAFARRSDRLRIAAPHHAFRAGPAVFAGVDTTRVFWGASEAGPWLHAVGDEEAAWHVVLAHHPYRSLGPHGDAGWYEGLPLIPYASGRRIAALVEAEVCGRFDLYLSGHDHSRQWHEACGTGFVVSGAGAKPTPVRDGDAVFASGSEGFVWVELGPDDAQLAFYDAGAGRIDFEAVRRRDGSIAEIAP